MQGMVAASLARASAEQVASAFLLGLVFAYFHKDKTNFSCLGREKAPSRVGNGWVHYGAMSCPPAKVSLWGCVQEARVLFRTGRDIRGHHRQKLVKDAMPFSSLLAA